MPGSSNMPPIGVQDIQGALARDGIREIAFKAEIRPDGGSTLTLLRPSPAVQASSGYRGLEVLILADGSLPEPWHRLPDPVPGAVPAPSADLELLERTLRERLPDAVGATEEEIAAVEARLGVTLSDELKLLYRVTRASENWDDYEAMERVNGAVGCEVFSLEGLEGVDGAARFMCWELSAKQAVGTPPDAAVQGLAGSPGWIVFGSNGGDYFAVDLTPGPGGHLGQVILVDHEQSLGAELVADSLTDFVLGRMREEERDRHEGHPVAANVGSGDIQAAIHPALEVVFLVDGPPSSIAPLAGLPHLRTLTASPGTLADPLEIAGLNGLEYLELDARDWRVLLDAGAVPKSLSAAAVNVRHQDHFPVVADEILALWGRSRTLRTLLEGDLGPVA